MADLKLIASAARNADKLRRLNVITLCVAVVVYIGLLGIAVYYRVFGLAVFSSCYMLAELLVFQFVRTLSDHLALVRRPTDLDSNSRIGLQPIGFVKSTRKDLVDDCWDSETSQIDLVDSFPDSALSGLDQFSHCLVVYFFDKAEWNSSQVLRHPRGNASWPKVGIFAQRAKDRPNRLGVSVCQIVGVKGRTISVVGLDAIDGTPVVDIKPWMAEFGPRGEVTQPQWSTELMQNYW